MKTLIIIPAYDEEENIINTIRDIEEHATGVDYIVINDCSKDNTKNILEDNRLHYVDLPVNLGIGGGVQTGYRYAYENGYDIAVQFDGDGQHMAKYIDNLVEPIKSGQADVVIGSRFITKEGFQSSAMRRFGIGFLSRLIKMLCGVLVLDVTSGMRAVNRKMICEYANNYPQDYPEPDAIITAGLMGMTIKEIPVTMRERQGGVSSISPLKSIYYMTKVSLSLIISRLAYKGGNK